MRGAQHVEVLAYELEEEHLSAVDGWLAGQAPVSGAGKVWEGGAFVVHAWKSNICARYTNHAGYTCARYLQAGIVHTDDNPVLPTWLGFAYPAWRRSRWLHVSNIIEIRLHKLELPCRNELCLLYDNYNNNNTLSYTFHSLGGSAAPTR
eukprot:767415-Prorocentrum_minimum.AAC.2